MKTVSLPQIHRRVPVAEGGTVLEAALRAGAPFPHGCRSGRCGSCKSELLSGEVEMLQHSPFALTAAERDSGQILACRAVPKTDVTVAWLDDEFIEKPAIRQKAQVIARDKMTHDIMRLRLALEAPVKFRFAAGQYLNLTMADAPMRSYSMANRPDEAIVELHVRHVPDGKTSTAIHRDLAVGDRVEIEGPCGSAWLRDAHDGPIIALAGGSGLAPIRSIVETALHAGMKQPICLYFGVRREEDLYLVDHFEDLAKQFPNLTFIPVLSQSAATRHRTGFVTDALAFDHHSRADARAYVAGPPGMVDAAYAVLTERGVPAANIHADVFFTPEEEHPKIA